MSIDCHQALAEGSIGKALNAVQQMQLGWQFSFDLFVWSHVYGNT
jgi:hypothetical protein